MAGTILVNDQSGLGTSTFEFDYLVERIRQAFAKDEEGFLQEIYRPLDEGGMTFVSLSQVGSDGFRAFARAARLACSRAATEEGFEHHRARWAELLHILERDPRYAAGV